MTDFASDDIVCGQVTEDPFFLSFLIESFAGANQCSRYFWFISYKIINDVNTVIEAAEKIENPDATVHQLIGECYFHDEHFAILIWLGFMQDLIQ